MAYQYMPKIFYDSHKNPPALPPTYLMYGPLETMANLIVQDKYLVLDFHNFFLNDTFD